MRTLQSTMIRATVGLHGRVSDIIEHEVEGELFFAIVKILRVEELRTSRHSTDQ